ncbi:SDR family oxidoreductase [Sphingobacterium faecium]|uniref:dTDP-4-dehydrorhamnose reductase family protein n=1 Tax=Sphingobacterium faecium TaxID=34087 RepID=UPI0032087F7D
MKKILIIGIKGMAGHMLYNYYKNSKQFEVYGIARNTEQSDNVFVLDVSDNQSLSDIVSSSKFDCIINCIGVLNKDAEDNPSKAIWFNSYFPHFLEEITKYTQTKVIHISTDCVFSGKRGGYTEEDVKDGIGFYAQSKALGEVINNKDVTVRTSIIGPELNSQGIGLFHWFMTQPKEVTLKGFSKAYWSGITTLELAKVIEHIIEQNIVGLIQVAPTQKIDKYQLVQLFNGIYRNNEITIDEYDGYQVDKSLISLRKDFAYKAPSYEEMLIDQKDWMNLHRSLYSHYYKK